MTPGPAPRAWLLMAAGEDRQFGGNSGYDDEADVYYTWDSTVNNYLNIRVGDAIAVWDKRRLVGISVIEHISTLTREKLRFRCANAECGRSTIKERKRLQPRFKCQRCGHEFDAPVTETVTVTEYRSRHDAAWTPLENLLDARELRDLCKSPVDQNSMRPLDWAAFETALKLRGAESAVERVLGRALGEELSRTEASHVPFAQGHTETVVRVRRGQQSFREHLLKTMGGTCAFTGSAPDRVLEAGHLYSYAKLGEHHEHGGLMLRRDIHRLFDDGWLAVDPRNLKIDVSEKLETFPQYARLHDQALQVQVISKQAEWLEQHWVEHRG